MTKKTPDPAAYLRSLSAELTSQAQRVRDLIGDAHWLSDGGHKEFLLRAMLERHVPAAMLVCRGFLIANPPLLECSKEQDILIIDTFSEAPIFNQGGVAVTAPDCLLAVLSVKTTLRQADFRDAVRGLATAAELLPDPDKRSRCWFGAFFFEVEPVNPSTVYNWADDETLLALAKLTADNNSVVLSDAKGLVYIIDRHGPDLRIRGHATADGPAVLLALLLGHLSAVRGNPEPSFTKTATAILSSQPIAPAQRSFICPGS